MLRVRGGIIGVGWGTPRTPAGPPFARPPQTPAALPIRRPADRRRIARWTQLARHGNARPAFMSTGRADRRTPFALRTRSGALCPQTARRRGMIARKDRPADNARPGRPQSHRNGAQDAATPAQADLPKDAHKRPAQSQDRPQAMHSIEGTPAMIKRPSTDRPPRYAPQTCGRSQTQQLMDAKKSYRKGHENVKKVFDNVTFPCYYIYGSRKRDTDHHRTHHRWQKGKTHV